MSLALLIAAFTAGLLGSTHCAAMCGPIVSLFEAQHSRADTLSPQVRRLAYQTGRMLFYVSLGATVSFAAETSLTVSGFTPSLDILRYVAGVLLILLGLRLACPLNVFRYLDQLGLAVWRRLSPLAKFVLPMNTIPKAIGAGFLWGAIPCGMVYAVLALSLGAGNTMMGALVMFSFWLGTLPLLLGAGSTLSLLLRTPTTTRLAGLTMAVVGAVSLWSTLPSSTGEDHHQHHHHAMHDVNATHAD